MCGWAGVSKEKELSAEKKKEVIAEFNFVKGLWIAVFAGVMSACMNYGVEAGEPIARLAIKHGTRSLWQNTPVFVVVLASCTSEMSLRERSEAEQAVNARLLKQEVPD